jgi:hypothetical protein
MIEAIGIGDDVYVEVMGNSLAHLPGYMHILRELPDLRYIELRTSSSHLCLLGFGDSWSL